ALFANLYLHETLPPIGYLGGGLVVIGAVIHTTGIALPSTEKRLRKSISTTQRRQPKQLYYVKPIAITIAFTLFLAAEFALLYSLGGFPPRSWLALYRLWPHLSTLAQSGQTTFVVLLWVQAICWLIAWLASILMALLIVSYCAGKLQPAQTEEDFALRYYFSKEDTVAIPATRTTPLNPATPIWYPAHFVSPVEETSERMLVEEFLREYL
ncbi:MAG TPA: hypothetical protein VKR42_00270, partial [Ktedonobacteraceae bacterium]|nr:hypothetical protein [Ktedonobacteraceae bacterium]